MQRWHVPTLAGRGSWAKPPRWGVSWVPNHLTPPADSSAPARSHRQDYARPWRHRKRWDPQRPTYVTGTKKSLKWSKQIVWTWTSTADTNTYTCFAPAFIFKSCLISRMTHFRSLEVHLWAKEMEWMWRKSVAQITEHFKVQKENKNSETLGEHHRLQTAFNVWHEEPDYVSAE